MKMFLMPVAMATAAVVAQTAAPDPCANHARHSAQQAQGGHGPDHH